MTKMTSIRQSRVIAVTSLVVLSTVIGIGSLPMVCHSWMPTTTTAANPGNSRSRSRDALLPGSFAPTVATASTALLASSPGGNSNPALAGSSSSNDGDDTLELLQELPLVPKEVLSKFLASVGDSLTRANLQAGYQAGVVSSDELEEIATRMPGLDLTAPPSVQSVDSLRKSWDDSAEGQPWPVRKLCGLAGPTVVGLVAKLQERSVRQASTMAWINGEALALLQSNTTIVELLSPSDVSASTTRLRFNNTRARFEPDKGVWSASMDVFDEARQNVLPPPSEATTTPERAEPSAAQTALDALIEGVSEDSDVDNNDADDFLSMRVGVLDPTSSSSVSSTTTTTAAPTPGSSPIGLVNAYFVPDEEIKILVVEIDGILHNVTWKGLG
eukprot:jgi/Psemu1/292330/fgenesh1_pg.1010_\